MPFGLVTACATYIRLKRPVLAGLRNFCFYFDIFVFSTNYDEHLDALRSVFERLRHDHLNLKPSKWCFLIASINYLCFILDGTFLRPQHDKIGVINKLPLVYSSDVYPR